MDNKRQLKRFGIARIAKNILILTLAIMMLLTFVACDTGSGSYEEDEDTSINDLNGYESKKETTKKSPSTSTNEPESEQEADNTPETNNNSVSSGTIITPNLSTYSELLQRVLTNEEYNQLIKVAHNTNPALLKTGEFEPHPYAFLEKKGFDVEAIKKGDDLCRTFSYVLTDDKGSLYMHTQVDCGDYYETFLLKYTLSEQEMQDYHLTQTGGGNVEAPYYIQCAFMNREIAATREPEIVGTSKMAKQSLDSLKTSMGGGKYGIETQTCNIIFINPNRETNEFDLILYPRNQNAYGISCRSIIADLECYNYQRLESGICTTPNAHAEFMVLDQSKTNAILYFTQDEEFGYLSNRNLNWEHMN